MEIGFSAEDWRYSLVIIGMVFTVVSIPCVATAILGTRLINHIGRYPTRFANVLLSTCVKLAVVEVISFVLLAGMLHVLDT